MKQNFFVGALVTLTLLASNISQAQPKASSQFHVPFTHQQGKAAAHELKGKATRPAPGAQRPQVKQANSGRSNKRMVHPRGGGVPVSTIGFVSALQINAGGGAYDSPYLGDFNGDGKKDFVTVVYSESGSSLSVVLSAGDGTFSAPVLTELSSSDPIVVADFNGDGKDDIIQVHSNSAPSTVDVWLAHSNGDGGFTAGSQFQVSTTTLRGGVATDVDADGKQDLIAVDTGETPTVWTLLGNGDGTFQTATSVAMVAPTVINNLTFADFNGDGKVDLAATDKNDQVNVFLQAAGTFVAVGLPLETSDAVYDTCSLAAGELASSGGADIVSVNCNDNNLTVYTNNGDGTFPQGVYYDVASASGTPANTYPYGASIADVNSDGRGDILVTNYYSSDVTVMLGNGDGTVTVPTVGHAVGGYPYTPALAADFNGDGLQDLVVADDESSFVYLQGYGDGTFRAALDYYGPTAGSDGGEGVTVASADFNQDGFPDIVLGNCCGQDATLGVTVFLARPDGSLEPGVNYGVGGSLEFVAVGDFNEDGHQDIAATSYSTGTVNIFSGLGDGTFGLPVAFATASSESNPYSLATGDFNHDGHLDLAVLNLGSQNAGILLGDGAGNFGAPVTYPIEGYGYDLSVADLDGDGYLDLIAPFYEGSSVGILLGNNDNTGTFKAEQDTAFGFNGLNVATAGDLNNDGKVDLAVTVDDYQNGHGIAISLGNGDGTFQAATLYPTTLKDPSVSQPYTAYLKMFDLNADGNLDLIYTNSNLGTVGILYGHGDGTFDSPVEYPSGGYPLRHHLGRCERRWSHGRSHRGR